MVRGEQLTQDGEGVLVVAGGGLEVGADGGEVFGADEAVEAAADLVVDDHAQGPFGGVVVVIPISG